MAKTNDISRLFLLRSASALLLLYVLTVIAVFNETDGFTDWTGSIRVALPAMLLFVACYTVSQAALLQEDSVLLLRLLWIKFVPLVILHFVLDEMGMLLSFIAFWIARTPHSYGLRTCSYLTLGLVTFFLVVIYLRNVAEPLELLFIALLTPKICLFVLSISYTAACLQQQRQEALQLNRELKAAQLLLAQSSRSNERLRIAREIHDLLGHQMTALLLNLEVATHKTTSVGLVHVERAQALAKMLLGDLRNAVSELRENSALDFDAALEELLANVPKLEVTLDRETDLAVHDPQAAEVLLRCIQEALTNTLRHAHAKSCHIRLYREDDQLVLDIRDDGISPVLVKPGNGLKGMKERLGEIAGSLNWHNDKGSFRLHARLPCPEEPA